MVFNVSVEINSSKSFVVNPVHHPVQPSEWQLEPSVFGHGFAAEAHNEVAQWRLVEGQTALHAEAETLDTKSTDVPVVGGV